MAGKWGDTVVPWSSSVVTWDGTLLVSDSQVTMQSVATYAAQAGLSIKTAQVLGQVVATLIAEAALVRKAQTTMQVVATYAADGTVAVAGEAVTTLQSVTTFVPEATRIHHGVVTMQSVATFGIGVPVIASGAETLMQVVASFEAQAPATIVHDAETTLQTVAYMLADPEVHHPATGEWYIRGGSFYPPPANRRKMMQRAHVGAGRRIG